MLPCCGQRQQGKGDAGDGIIRLDSPQHCPTSATRERVLCSHLTPVFSLQLQSLELHFSSPSALWWEGRRKLRDPEPEAGPRGGWGGCGNCWEAKVTQEGNVFHTHVPYNRRCSSQACAVPGSENKAELPCWATSSYSVPYTVSTYRCSALNQSLSDAYPEPHWVCLTQWDFDGNIYNCEYQICFLWMCSSVYLKLALSAMGFASKHLCCGIFGTWAWTGTLTQPNIFKAQVSAHRVFIQTLQLHYFCSKIRSNLCEHDCPWAIRTKWSSPRWGFSGSRWFFNPTNTHLGKFSYRLIQSFMCSPGLVWNWWVWLCLNPKCK